MISVLFFFLSLFSSCSAYTFQVDVQTLVGGGVSGSQSGDSLSPSPTPLFDTVGGIGLDTTTMSMCVTDSTAMEVRLVDIPSRTAFELGGDPSQFPGFNDGDIADPDDPDHFTLYDTPKGCATQVTGGIRYTYVADSFNCFIRRIKDTFSLKISGGPIPTEPSYRQLDELPTCSSFADAPTGVDVRWSDDIGTIVITPNNNLLVLDTGNSALRLMQTTSANFGGTKTVGGRLRSPGYVDGTGNVGIGSTSRFINPTYMQYVASLKTLFIVDVNRIRAVKVPDDEINGLYLISTFGPATLPFTPIGLALDDVNHIMYVTSDSNQLYALITTPVYDVVTNIVSIAGSSTAGSTNGVGSVARFNSPQDMQLRRDPSGNVILYINDQGNSKIRQVNITYKPSSVSGDPQFIGFQGQTYQVHGQPDEIFNLISAPDLSMNANFVYLQTSLCNYTNTKCFTHPGTYVDALGFRLGFDEDDQVKIIAGSHANGLRVWHNNTEMEVDDHVDAMDGDISITRTDVDRVDIRTPTFMIGIVNSDGFFNLEIRLTDIYALKAGHIHRIGKDIQHYPFFPYHGLIGQTWRNALYTQSNSPIEGEIDDYRIESHDLFGLDYTYNMYLKKNSMDTIEIE